MSQGVLVVRRADQPGVPLAHTPSLDTALGIAADRAAGEPGVLFEVLQCATGTVSLRVRADNTRTVLVQQPGDGNGDAWPDPPAWRPLVAHR
jgi:hypothetical protein